ncbi:PspC domain-containing protein [Nocardia sp. NBC_00565]|uniref:PspC domain-containing protein n=1 Tax=Nocardia sp. NBC_00565 TaxID=2975993 RepID=UPI002E8177F5|nr:PspC domain-containing protein [Nocardia sp. NBC_00565]WUC02970.1 PspC domain-containing protein [Nocardia sp. NBC_00565]
MGTMTKTSFGDQLHQMWQTRPVRLPRQGPIAGIAAGFGQRYGIDPVLVRVALVVSTIFGGAGIVLYLLAWLLLSEAGDQSSAAESLFGKGQSSQSQTKTIVLIVALAIAVSTMGPVGVGLAGSGLISMALLLAGWWMLHMRNPQPPPGTSSLNPFDGGLTATGYPGAVFPQRTMPGDFYSPDVPPTSMYTPYTKLPDAYVPDTPVQSTAQAQQADADTVLLNNGDAETELIEKSTAPMDAGTTPADAETVMLHKGDTGTTALDKGDDIGAAPLGKGTTQVETAAHPRGSTPPSSWDPLGVAPLAWDLPEPTPTRTIVAPAPKRPRSRLTPVVLGLAILAAAGAGALAAAGVDWMTPGRIGAVALAVIGLGLVLGAFLRRGYGLLVLTAPLAGFVVLASMIGPIAFDSATVGDRTWTPTAMADLAPKYELTIGTGTLDLRSLNLTESRAVEVAVQLGDANILLPAGMTVHADCTVNLGDVQCPTGITGPNTPGAPVLDLKVNVRTGNAEVHRG